MTDERNDDAAARNRRSWNAATAAHNRHKQDQAGFLKRGGSTLFPDELALAGDVAGRRLLHLQCNAGQDSLSLAALGAEVTGVDLSDEAIAFARRLSEESGIAATFERSEVCAWLERAARDGRRFDLAFATYGVLGWNEDIDRWMRGVRGVLAPGGRLVSLEFHPLVWSFDADGRIVEPYFLEGPIHEPGVADYVAEAGDGLTPMGRVEGVEPFENPHPCVGFQWTVADVVNAATGAGLAIERLVEYPYSNGARVRPDLVEIGDRRFGFPEGTPATPLMLGMVARRD